MRVLRNGFGRILIVHVGLIQVLPDRGAVTVLPRAASPIVRFAPPDRPAGSFIQVGSHPTGCQANPSGSGAASFFHRSANSGIMSIDHPLSTGDGTT
jgi:hypothetical protein